MKTINKQSENMGGVLRLWAIPKSDITLSGKTLTIVSDTNMVSIYTSEDSATFVEEIVKSFAGTVFKVEITAKVPGDNSGTLNLIAEMERRSKYLVVYIDGNGNYKLAGSTDAPLRFSSKATTGTGAAGLNNYAITFSGQQLKRALFIDSPFT